MEPYSSDSVLRVPRATLDPAPGYDGLVMSERPELTVVIPAYNEEINVAIMHERLAATLDESRYIGKKSNRRKTCRLRHTTPKQQNCCD